MKEYRIQKRTALRYWGVVLVSTAMIGAACWFAYTQTADLVQHEMDSTVSSIRELPAAHPETAIPRTTTTPRHTTAPPIQTTAARTEPAAVIYAPSTTAATTVTTETTTLPPSQATPSRWPVEGAIIQPFSNGELVKSETTGVWQTHNGVDLACTPGDPVYAMDPGTVTAVTDDPLWGMTVTVDHKNGIITRYCGLAPGLDVTEGDTVTNVDPLGCAGETADCESALPTHVHFEVRQGDRYIDPEAYLASGE